MGLFWSDVIRLQERVTEALQDAVREGNEEINIRELAEGVGIDISQSREFRMTIEVSGTITYSGGEPDLELDMLDTSCSLLDCS